MSSITGVGEGRLPTICPGGPLRPAPNGQLFALGSKLKVKEYERATGNELQVHPGPSAKGKIPDEDATGPLSYKKTEITF